MGSHFCGHGEVRGSSIAECLHVTFLLFKLRHFAPSPRFPLALIFNSVAAQRAGPLCLGDFSNVVLKQGQIILPSF